MNARSSLILLLVSILTMAVIREGTYEAEAHKNSRPNNAQNQERTVVDISTADTPVKITLIRTKKRVVEKDKQFLAEDDWLQGLTLRVVNRSQKTVTYVGVRLLFRRTRDQDPGLPAGSSLDYGFDPFLLKPGEPVPDPLVTPIPPGGEVSIELSDSVYSDLKVFLAQAGFPVSHKRLELMITSVGFNDETMWLYRHMFRRDPTSLGKPYPGWRPLDDAFDDMKQPEKEKGGAKGSTAFFIFAGFKNHHKGNQALFNRFVTNSFTEEVSCGVIILSQVACGNTGGAIDCRYRHESIGVSALHPDFKSEPFDAECKGTFNGVTVTCTSPRPSLVATPCTPPCGNPSLRQCRGHVC